MAERMTSLDGTKLAIVDLTEQEYAAITRALHDDWEDAHRSGYGDIAAELKRLLNDLDR